MVEYTSIQDYWDEMSVIGMQCFQHKLTDTEASNRREICEQKRMYFLSKRKEKKKIDIITDEAKKEFVDRVSREKAFILRSGICRTPCGAYVVDAERKILTEKTGSEFSPEFVRCRNILRKCGIQIPDDNIPSPTIIEKESYQQKQQELWRDTGDVLNRSRRKSRKSR